MDITNVLEVLEENNISIALDGDDLDVNFSQETISDHVIDLLRTNKPLLVSYLKEITRTSSFRQIPEVLPDTSYPLSSSQMRLWILSQIDEVSLTYNLPFTFRMQGDYDFEIFEKSILALVQRHESLRTVFRQDKEGNIRQWIIPFEKFHFKVGFKDYHGIENAQVEIESAIAQDKKTPFDLEKGPLFKVTFFKLKEDSYLCYLNIHHIISDGWSMNILVRDITSFYKAFSFHTKTGLKDLRIQYKDYAVWQNEQIHSQAYDAHRRFWLNKLSGNLPTLNFPIDKQRPALKTTSGRILGAYLEKEECERIQEYIKAQGGSLFMFLLASVNVLLHKYTSKEDIIVGSPIAGRDDVDLEEQIGCYINTLVIRSKVERKMSFNDFYAQIRKDVLESFAHRSYPFDHLIKELGAGYERDAGRNPLFDVMVVLQNTENYESEERASEVFLGGKEHDRIAYSKFDLEITFVEVGDRIGMGVNYNTDIYDYPFVNDLMKHFQQLVRNLIITSDEPLASADYFSKEELSILLTNLDTTVDYPKEKTFLNIFAEQATLHPDAIALADGDQQFTYKELYELSGGIADFLENTCADAFPIGILMERSALMVALLLGVMRSGRAYIPLDPKFPEDRLKYIIHHSGITLLISDSESSDLAPGISIIISSNILKELKPAQKAKLKQPSGKDTAYIIYTSGSTGHPKGVEIGHQSLLNFLLSMQQAPGIKASDCLFSVTTYSFDISILEFFAPLLSGARVFIAKHEVLSDAEKLMDVLEKQKPTIIQATPSFYQLLFNAGWKGDATLKVLCGGDALTVSLAEKLLAVCGEVWNMYGPTETTIWSSIKKIEQASDAVIIGKPIANTTFYVLNEFKEFMPQGCLGNLYIGGDGLAKGYYKNESLTNQRFIKNPFGSGKLYETGDVVKWNAAKELVFFGRNDHQVKIRGYRIELGEIENTILSFSEEMLQAAVVVHESTGGKVLIGYYTEKTVQDKERLKEYLKEQLPVYMIPAQLKELEEIPLTPNGKIDRKALTNLSVDYQSGSSYAAPRNETEQTLVEIWENILGHSKIGIRDNFFDIGGNSLMIAQVINQIYKRLNSSLSFKDFFQEPFIEGMVKKIKSQAYVSIPKAPLASSYPLTPTQQRLWVLSQLEGGNSAYNISSSVMLKGELDIEKFRKAFSILINKHEVLRTIFKTSEEGEVRQFILDGKELNFEIGLLDYEKQSKSAVDSYLITEQGKPFDFNQAPLLTASLLKTGKDAYLFSFVIHHIISDGWSLQLLISEVITTYNQLLKLNATEEELPTESLPIQFKDYAVWLQSELYRQAYATSESYWLKKFEGELPVLELPSLKNRPKLQTYNGHTLYHQYAGDFLNKAKEFSNAHGATLFMTLMAGINALFYRYTNQQDIIIGTPVAGRTHDDLENQIGLYLNTLAIRTRLEKGDSFENLISAQKQTIVDAFEHQQYPFGELVSKLNLKRDTSRSALFDVLVVLQNQNQLQRMASADAGLSGMEVQVYELEGRTSQFDMSFTFVETAGKLNLGIEYNTDIYDEFLIKRIFRHFENLLNSAIAHPKAELRSLDYLTKEESTQLLKTFNNTEATYPKDKSLIDLFEAQVELTPDNIAVIYKDKRLTYKELNEASNRLGHYLRTHHQLKRNDLVAIKLERTEALLISILGVLKSGAAYVPVDVNYPPHRIAYIEQDSKSKLVIESDFIKLFDTVKEEYSTENPKKVTQAGDLAYIIYTSGTTGNPKGVMVGHNNAVTFIHWSQQEFSSEQFDIVHAATSQCFDLSIYEMFYPLSIGKPLRILQDALELVEMQDREKKVLINTVPSSMRNLLESGANMDHVSVINLAGEPFPVEIANRLRKKNATIRNLYGPSEDTTYSTVYKLEKTKEYTSSVSIGKPISNTRVYILDECLGLVPAGVSGRLYISGDGLSQGYLNRLELTAEKFISNPFEKGEKMYDTGDMVRWQLDGNIDYLGRKDDQVKIRGYRIELGEIENAMLSYSEDIAQATVVVHESAGGKLLIGYYTEKTVQDKERLKEYLKEQLPVYMIPAQLKELKEIPLTPNGKIDRKALANLNVEYQSGSSYLAPRNETEQTLVEIWESILGHNKIGIRDNFFDIGGNSLMIQHLLYQSNKQLRVTLTYNDIFQLPTIQELSEIILKQKEESASPIVLEEVFLMKKNGNSNKNIFFIHDGVGSLNSYVPMINIMEDYNCWGVKSDLFRHVAPQNINLTELAGSYLKKIKQVQPAGPYALIGWSGGGVVAFEMVKQLESEDERIDLLLMIDSTFPGKVGMDTNLPFTVDNEINFYSGLLPELKELKGKVNDVDEFWSAILEKADHSQEMKNFLMNAIAYYREEGDNSDFNSMSTREMIIQYNTTRSITRMNGTYQPKPIHNSWSYIKASDTKDVDMDWLKTYSKKEVEVIEMEGNHHSIMKGGVNEILEIIQSIHNPVVK